MGKILKVDGFNMKDEGYFAKVSLAIDGVDYFYYALIPCEHVEAIEIKETIDHFLKGTSAKFSPTYDSYEWNDTSKRILYQDGVKELPREINRGKVYGIFNGIRRDVDI